MPAAESNPTSPSTRAITVDARFNDGADGVVAVGFGCAATMFIFGVTGAIATVRGAGCDDTAANDGAGIPVPGVRVRLADIRIADELVADGAAFTDSGVRPNGEWTCGSLLDLVCAVAAPVCAPPLLCTTPRGSLETGDPDDTEPVTDVEPNVAVGGVSVTGDPVGADGEDEDASAAGEAEPPDGLSVCGEPLSGDEAPEELLPDVSSAHAAGAPSGTAAPTPSATANPPTRPTKRPALMAALLRSRGLARRLLLGTPRSALPSAMGSLVRSR